MMGALREFAAARRRAAMGRTPQAKALAAVQRTGVVFVHIPKCGGKSVVRDVYNLTEHEWFGHAGIAFYRSLLGERRFAKAQKFAFVRDPVSRCQSGFRFAKRGGFGLPSDKERAALLGTESFEDFVLGGSLERMAREDRLFLPQSGYILLPDGTFGVDHVCVFERFATELAALPLPTPVAEPSHVNAAPARSHVDILPALRARIVDVYAEDYRTMARLGDKAPDWVQDHPDVQPQVMAAP